MSKFIINGGRKLHGAIKTNSAKNSAVAILCASAMIKGRTVLTDMPRIEEVSRIIEILTSIGLEINWLDRRRLEIINRGAINLSAVNQESFQKTRAAILLIGALSRVFKKFSLPRISGCKLGKRTVNPHIMALNHLGIEVKKINGQFQIDSAQAKSAAFTMYESGDTATENAILAAVALPNQTEINLASSNYMVQDLCYFLLRAGAKIKGIGTTKLRITGVKKLKPISYPVMPDPIESMAFISIAVTTGSALKIIGCPVEFLNLELEKLKVMGQKIKISQPYKSANRKFDLVDIGIVPSKLNALPDKIYGRPFPGLNIDNLPLFLPILTQARGRSLVHDWVYENRAVYYKELNKLGADITLYDQHRVSVTGPTKLKPAKIICPPALRPAINLLICMLAARGQSTLRDSYSIDRGYENICERLNRLGADIKRVD